jgi:hypothetical protein
MILTQNPFEYEAANKFTGEQILDLYIKDFNYSRFICSRRNIFLVGERGIGKTMTLLYNSFPVQQIKAVRNQEYLGVEIICVYVPCNTSLTHRNEYQLLEDFQASVVSEHFLVLSIMHAIVDTLSSIPDLLDDTEITQISQDLEFVLDMKLPAQRPLFEGLKLLFQREVTRAQRAINAKTVDAFYDRAISFSAGVLPLITHLRKIDRLKKSHFALMLDDAHDLNFHQIRVLNSWIAFRDNTIFSFKVATAKVDLPTFKTSSGGNILEGHDFTLIDMEQPYQNKYSAFGKLAKEIIKRRLEKIDLKKDPHEFFPINPQFEKDIEEHRKIVMLEAEKKFPEGTAKQKSDHVYKYARASYFRHRASSQANLPPYSGFDTIVHISTGVIRNLLEPCYWMYDRALSEKRANGETEPTVDQILHSIQTEIILERSKQKWEWIKDRLDKTIEGCSQKDAVRIYQLFDNLAVLFRERLINHMSEPRAITFTISDVDYEHHDDLLKLLKIARKAQILYVYTSSAKDLGKRESYYVPNRILWPNRGLDPEGQHARVSLKSRNLWVAAVHNKKIPFLTQTEKGQDAEMRPKQGRLFDDLK